MKSLKPSAIVVLISFLTISFSYHPLFSQTGWIPQTSNIDLPISKIYFINENTGWASSAGGYTFVSGGHFIRTTNGGQNWVTIIQGFVAYSSFCFLEINTGWLTGEFYDDLGNHVGFIFKSTNSGLNWSINYSDSVLSGFDYIYFSDFNNGIVTGGSDTAFVLKTTNAGSNWVSYLYPGIRFLNFCSFINDQTGWAIAGFEGSVYKTSNFGTSFNSISNYAGSQFYSVFFLDSLVGWISGDNGLILKSTNGGYNWFSQYSGVNSNLNSISFMNYNTGWCSGSLGKILFTSNGGNNWIMQVSSTTYDLNSIYFINLNTGWSAGGVSASFLGECTILKTTTGGLIPVKHLGEAVPLKYFLCQNYPNPFNPITKIRFDVPKSENTYLRTLHLTVYDILGREIKQLVNESNLKPGTYEVEWDASSYASGVYFYRLEAGDYNETKKMVLIK